MEREQDFEFILEIYNTGDLVFLKSLLVAEGIVFFIQGEHVAPYLYHALPMRLMVRKDQIPLVKELFQDIALSSAYSGLKM